jgi:hypothetical protein
MLIQTADEDSEITNITNEQERMFNLPCSDLVEIVIDTFADTVEDSGRILTEGEMVRDSNCSMRCLQDSICQFVSIYIHVFFF